MIRTPRSRSTLWRWSPVSSPQRHSVQGGGDDQQAGGFAAEYGSLFGDAEYLGLCCPDPFAFEAVAASPSASVAADGVGGDESFVGGVGEDHREDFDDGRDG